MMIQISTGLPLLQQAETVLVFDIAKNSIAQTTHFLARRFDHGQKGLHNLQLLFREYVHGNS